MKLLIVEDNLAMLATLQRAFERRGMAVFTCHDGNAALARWHDVQPDVVLLDLSLPGQDGLQLLERARQQGLRTPVLIQTARGTVGDRILGLNAGADDYLPKPFDLDELEARVRALMRRSGRPAVPLPSPADGCCGMTFNELSGVIYHQSQPMSLTPRESALLRALLARPGHAIAKERLFELVFPDEDTIAYEAIEVVVYRLRKKIAHTGAQVVTLRGLGYLLKAAS